MRQPQLYIIVAFFIWIFLAQCFISRNRISDDKGYKIFSGKHISLNILDTVIKNRHIHYAISGSDSLPTLVFIHGSPGSWMNYMKFMYDSSLLSKFRIVSIDRPGLGFSDFGHALHLKEQCALILPVLKSLRSDKPMFLCGHSMGGPVTIQLAAADPNLFSTIIIVAGAIDVKQESKERWRYIMGVKPFYWLLPGAFGPSNTELLYLKKDLILLKQEFSKITCKVHFVHGSKDTWVPIENVAYGKKMLVNAKDISADTLAGADHQIPWKNRQALKEILFKLY